MQLEEFNNHKIHQLFLELKELRDTNEILQKSESLELAFLTDASINTEVALSRINAFLISLQDLNSISSHLQQIIHYLKNLTLNSNLSYVADHIRTYLLNITKILSGYPIQNKKLAANEFNKISATYKQDAEEFNKKMLNELTAYKDDLNKALQESNSNKDYLNNLVGDIKGFSAKYTTKEKAKYYSELSAASESKADGFLKYTNIAMFSAIGFILLPILLPMIHNIWYNSWYEIFPSDILNLSFGGAILRISISFLAFLPALFFSQIERQYRERAFRFKDLSNAILSINPYLADIEQNQYGNYSEKDKLRLEMAKIFFTQIHSNDKCKDKDLLNKMEQIANIVKGIKS